MMMMISCIVCRPNTMRLMSWRGRRRLSERIRHRDVPKRVQARGTVNCRPSTTVCTEAWSTQSRYKLSRRGPLRRRPPCPLYTYLKLLLPGRLPPGHLTWCYYRVTARCRVTVGYFCRGTVRRCVTVSAIHNAMRSQCDFLAVRFSSSVICTVVEEGLSQENYLRLTLRLRCGFCQITLTSFC